MHLVHETLLAVVVSVLHGVELVKKRRLGLLGGRVTSLGRVKTGTGGRVTSPGRLKSGADAGADTSTSGRVTKTGRRGVVVIARANGSASGSTREMVVLGGGTNSSALKSAAGGAGRMAADGAGLTLETIVTLLTSSQDTALLLKVGHANGGKSRCRVVLGSVVVNLVDRDDGVDDVGLNSLLLDNGLDSLVDVVVNVLTSNGGSNRLSVTLNTLDTHVTELSGLGLQALGNLALAAMLEFAVLNSTEVVVVLLCESLAVLDGLDRGVVVVLVDLLINGGLDLLAALSVDGLVDNSGRNLLVDGGVMVTRLGPTRY